MAPRPRVALAFLLVLLAALRVPRAGAQTIVPMHFDDQLVAGNLDSPTNGVFLPDGRMLVTEQYTGRIRLVLATSSLSTVVGVVDSIYAGGEAGLVGITVDPAWPAKPYVYVQATRQNPDRVVIWRYRLTGALSNGTSPVLGVVNGTRYTVFSIPNLSPKHNGGTLRFGIDGKLYAGVGDDDSPCDAQNLASPNGKILRLDVSGLPDGAGGPPPYAAITPADNPFVARPDTTARLVWAYGLRNPFSFEVDRTTGCLIVGDVGNESWEEVDLLCSGGQDLGWPLYEGPMRLPISCASPDTTNLVPPIYAYPHVDPGWAIVGGPAYHAPGGAPSLYPAGYDGSIFLGDTWRGLIKNIDLSGASWALSPPVPGQADPGNWATGANWITHLEVGPDGALWYTILYRDSPATGPGEVRRILYYAPSVDADAGPAGGVRLDAPRPSPARGSTVLSWSIPAPARVDVTLYDARGRLVRRLVRSGGRLGAAGDGSARWDGRDDQGRAAAPGVYLVRLQAGAAERRTRFVLLN